MTSKALLFTGLLVVVGSFGWAQEACSPGSKKANKLYDKAQDEMQVKNFPAAADYLQEAIDADEEFAKGYFWLARIRFEQQRFEDAIKQYNALINICPDYKPEVYFELGQAHYYLEEYGESAAFFTTFLGKEDIKPSMRKEADSLLKRTSFLDRIYNHPVPFNPQPIEGVSTKDGEYLPIISPDNELFLFVRNKPRDDSKSVIKGGRVEEFTVARKTENGFEVGDPLPPPFNQGANQGGATITINNKELFITICDDPKGKGSCDIFYTYQKNGNWQPLQNIDNLAEEPVNTQWWESQVSISPDGNTLYFSSDRPKRGETEPGDKDIYKIFKKPNGKWSKPFNLGPAINTDLDEKSPFVHVDNRTLYFSSQGHDNLGGFDIFYSRMDDNNNWQSPVNIGYPINSSSDDLGFFVSTDGKTGYFASNKMKGKGGWDIYSFELYNDARPQKVLFLKGEIKDPSGNVIPGAKIEIKNLETHEITEIEVDSATGEYVYTQTLEDDQMLTVTKKDYFYAAQVIQKDDTTFQAPKKLDFEMKKLEVGASFVMDNILFATDSYVLPESSKLELDNLADFLKRNPNIKISVDGHTDAVGDDNSNLILSRNRAEAVHNYLLTKGVPSTRITFKGYGETQPIASNDDAKGRAQNRRTEIKILEI